MTESEATTCEVLPGDALALARAQGEGTVSYELRCGDSREELKAFPDATFGLIVADPPYGLRKGFAGDHTPAQALSLVADVLPELARVLKPNGSLYLFAGPQVAARVEVAVGEWLHVLNRIIWVKHDGTPNRGGLWSRADKDVLRAYFSQYEAVIFAEHPAADVSFPIGEVQSPFARVMTDNMERLGLTQRDLSRLELSCNGNLTGWVYNKLSGTQMPTFAQWEKLCGRFGIAREYEDLRREYEDLRRPFSVSADVPYTDVWDFPTVAAYPGKHPCEKPQALLEHIIRTSSRPGDTVLDCFMGGGSTGEAAVKLGREFVGVEVDPHWCEVAERRLTGVHAQPTLIVESRPPRQPAPEVQGALL